LLDKDFILNYTLNKWVRLDKVFFQLYLAVLLSGITRRVKSPLYTFYEVFKEEKSMPLERQIWDVMDNRFTKVTPETPLK
jgi:hypothetical protein